jgi:hypothetical protein
MELVAARTFNTLYIWLDLAWLAVFAAVLLSRRRYAALLAGLAAGAVYFLVDYGVFYLLLGTRSVQGASPFWLLLWLSFSYGLTNLAWIWLLLDRDGHALEWSVLVIAGWLAVAFLSQGFGARFPPIAIRRGTSSYHGVMALILLAGYLILVARNLGAKGQAGDRVDLLRLLAIGIGVQFAWEAVLLLAGIRPPGLRPLIIDSLLETNLGMPYFYLIHRAIHHKSLHSRQLHV